jgi:hypothetical protein
MEIRKAEPSLVRAGFVLFTLALLTGFAVPAFLNQRVTLAAHLAGVLNALVLMALGLAWGLLALSPLQAKLTRGAFLYATYASWGASCLAAAWGTNRLTPLSGVVWFEVTDIDGRTRRGEHSRAVGVPLARATGTQS